MDFCALKARAALANCTPPYGCQNAANEFEATDCARTWRHSEAVGATADQGARRLGRRNREQPDCESGTAWDGSKCVVPKEEEDATQAVNGQPARGTVLCNEFSFDDPALRCENLRVHCCDFRTAGACKGLASCAEAARDGATRLAEAQRIWNEQCAEERDKAHADDTDRKRAECVSGCESLRESCGKGWTRHAVPCPPGVRPGRRCYPVGPWNDPALAPCYARATRCEQECPESYPEWGCPIAGPDPDDYLPPELDRNLRPRQR